MPETPEIPQAPTGPERKKIPVFERLNGMMTAGRFAGAAVLGIAAMGTIYGSSKPDEKVSNEPSVAGKNEVHSAPKPFAEKTEKAASQDADRAIAEEQLRADRSAIKHARALLNGIKDLKDQDPKIVYLYSAEPPLATAASSADPALRTEAALLQEEKALRWKEVATEYWVLAQAATDWSVIETNLDGMNNALGKTGVEAGTIGAAPKAIRKLHFKSLVHHLKNPIVYSQEEKDSGAKAPDERVMEAIVKLEGATGDEKRAKHYRTWAEEQSKKSKLAQQ